MPGLFLYQICNFYKGGITMKTKITALILSLLLALFIFPTAFAAESKPIYFGNTAIDWMADETLKLIPLEGKSLEEKATAVYDWMIVNCKRNDWDGTYYFDPNVVAAQAKAMVIPYEEKLAAGELVLHQDISLIVPDNILDSVSLHDSNMYINMSAANMFLTRCGNCSDFSSMLIVLLGHLGVDCRAVSGEFINLNGTRVAHTWNYALINGEYRWLDVRIDHSLYNIFKNGQLSRQYLMISDTNAWAKDHVWTHTYSDWLASNVEAVQTMYQQDFSAT